MSTSAASETVIPTLVESSPGSPMTSTTGTLDLKTCSASILANYVMEVRFNRDATAATDFFDECLRTLSNKSATSASNVKVETEEEEEEQVDSMEEDDMGKPLLSEPVEISMIQPRGKFQVMLFERGIKATTLKNPESIILASGSVENMLVFPKPHDCQRSSSKTKKNVCLSSMVLMCFGKEIAFKNKPITQVCFGIPAKPPVLDGEIRSNDEDTAQPDLTDEWVPLINESLDLDSSKVGRIVNPTLEDPSLISSWQFQSQQEQSTSTTTGGLPFVRCYHGVHDGVLYPMQEGLLFFKPPRFISRSQLKSIACGRGGNSSSRYVDLTLTTTSDQTIEFTNIHREELHVMKQYIHQVLIPQMRKDIQEDDESPGTEEDAPVVEASSRRGRTSQRRAAQEAILQMRPTLQDAGNEDSDDDDVSFERGEHDEQIQDDDDDDADEFVKECEKENAIAQMEDDDDDDDSEEEFRAEPDDTESESEDGTESEEDMQQQTKKRRTR